METDGKDPDATPEPPPARRSFSGRARLRKTAPIVKVQDTAARALITVGGLGTIFAVALVCCFLVWVVLPLFMRAGIQKATEGALAKAAEKPLRTGMDEYRLIGWTLHPDGSLHAFRLDSGDSLGIEHPFEGGPRLTAASFSIRPDETGFGFEDGSVRLGEIGFESEFIKDQDAPEEVRHLAAGQSANHKGGVVMRTPEGQLRWQRLKVRLGDPIKPEAMTSPSPVMLMDFINQGGDPISCQLNADGRLFFQKVRRKKNIATGKVTLTATAAEIPVENRGKVPPAFVKLSGVGDNIYLAWADGTVARYDVRDMDEPRLAEIVTVVPNDGARLTAFDFLIGRTTLVAGDSAGRVSAWFRIKPDSAGTVDGALLVKAHEMPRLASGVTALAASARTRTLAVGCEDGSVSLFNVTHASELGRVGGKQAPVLAMAVSPKDDALAAVHPGGFTQWALNLRHPEATTPGYFRPVWYEGYEKPAHVWQSSSGTDDFEPKLGLMPLVFGTLKATFYSMLFGVPIALLAALYTSEFLHPRHRARVKPTIELMASLPSVVLGFLAALVFAPLVEHIVPATLASFATVPLSLLIGAYLWQLLPQRINLRFADYRLIPMGVVILIGFLLAWVAGPMVEKLLFAGNLKLWLDAQIGGGIGGWFFLFLPVCAVTMFVVSAKVVTPWYRVISAQWGRTRCAAAEIVRFAVAGSATLILTLLIALILDGLGFDPRGGLVGTYIQRNALVVGFVMGFAIIPIIYTLADDALSTVPAHLRSASLAAGATQWQTATRVVIPTAMSGIFSAIMIGLGRAVGETMIVLMAAGNTPVMEWNVFNGFRTLSANIAVELPEAVRNSTHYRTLFLAALTLFVMTFILNTIAEVVRLRFRKRAVQL